MLEALAGVFLAGDQEAMAVGVVGQALGVVPGAEPGLVLLRLELVGAPVLDFEERAVAAQHEDALAHAGEVFEVAVFFEAAFVLHLAGVPVEEVEHAFFVLHGAQQVVVEDGEAGDFAQTARQAKEGVGAVEGVGRGGAERVGVGRLARRGRLLRAGYGAGGQHQGEDEAAAGVWQKCA